jgi:hypothetical protein
LKSASIGATIDDMTAKKKSVRTTVVLDEEQVARLQKLTGISERATLVRMGLQALAHREASARLARMGGTQPDLVAPPRRRFD